MRKILVLPALSFAAVTLPSCVSLLMAAYPPPSHDPAKVPPGIYKIEPYHTQVMFRVDHMGLSYFTGVFSDASGTVTLEPGKPAAMKVSVSVPVKTVLTTSPKLDEELVAPDWLDAAKFPTMSFVSTSVKVTGPGTADVTGTLTLHGVSKQEVLHAAFVGSGVNVLSHNQSAGFQISGMIKRSDFGVTKYIPLIGDEVQLIIAAAFEK
jgi:polyisoprenoid-binding protein YceI